MDEPDARPEQENDGEPCDDGLGNLPPEIFTWLDRFEGCKDVSTNEQAEPTPSYACHELEHWNPTGGSLYD